MAVFRVEKTNNYTVMSNYHLRDKNLSLKAKGLLSFMLSLPEDWDYSLNGLNSILKENETAIKTALDELKENGYLLVEKLLPNQTKSGKIEYVYNIYEQAIEKQGIENLGVEVQRVENQTQINTNIINTNNKYICSSINEQDNSSLKEKELADNFDKIWQIYPRKDGKNTAFNHYKSWLAGKKYAGRTIKLTNKQMWFAVKKYADLMEVNKTEKQYIKMGSTFFNEAIMEYVEEE